MNRTPIQVACGVLRNARGEVLIAQRPAGKPAAGKWEFPGGKLEPGESAAAALTRELREELGIELRRNRPLIRFRHDYSDRSVVLDTHVVDAWDGEPQSLEQQAFEWRAPDATADLDVLPTVAPILVALRLPSHYVFTPPDIAPQALFDGLPRLPAGALLRLRLPQLDDAAYADLATELLPRCRALGLKLMLDREPAMVERLGADGLHVRAAQLQALGARPRPESKWLAVSLHAGDAGLKPRELGADFGVLSPVLPTATHPDAAPLGWPGFSALAEPFALPLYALGGVGPAQLATALERHAQGVAGIRAYWSECAGHTQSR